MPNISISVQSKVAQSVGEPVIVCGNSDYTVTFTFDEEWSSLTEKTAHFRYIRGSSVQTDSVDFTGTSCSVPVLSDIDSVEIGVTAEDIRTTTPSRIPCIRCITDLKGEPYDPPADIYDELMEQTALAESDAPQIPSGYCFIIASDQSYIVTIEGDYIIAKE